MKGHREVVALLEEAEAKAKAKARKAKAVRERAASLGLLEPLSAIQEDSADKLSLAVAFCDKEVREGRALPSHLCAHLPIFTPQLRPAIAKFRKMVYLKVRYAHHDPADTLRPVLRRDPADEFHGKIRAKITHSSVGGGYPRYAEAPPRRAPEALAGTSPAYRSRPCSAAPARDGQIRPLPHPQPRRALRCRAAAAAHLTISTTPTCTPSHRP